MHLCVCVCFPQKEGKGEEHEMRLTLLLSNEKMGLHTQSLFFAPSLFPFGNSFSPSFPFSLPFPSLFFNSSKSSLSHFLWPFWVSKKDEVRGPAPTWLCAPQVFVSKSASCPLVESEDAACIDSFRLTSLRSPHSYHFVTHYFSPISFLSFFAIFFENASTYVEWTSTFHWIVNFLFRNFFSWKNENSVSFLFYAELLIFMCFFQLENAILMLALYENIPRFYECYFIICIVRAWKTSKNRCD